MSDDMQTFYFKVVMVGASQVGKTTIARAWAGRPLYSVDADNADVTSYSVELKGRGGTFVLDVLDPRREVGDEAAKAFLQDAAAVVMVYDRTRLQETRQVISSVWLPRVEQHLGRSKVEFLILNKGRGRAGSDFYRTNEVADAALFDSLGKFKEVVELVDSGDCEETQDNFMAWAEVALERLRDELFRRFQKSRPRNSRLPDSFFPEKKKVGNEREDCVLKGDNDAVWEARGQLGGLFSKNAAVHPRRSKAKAAAKTKGDGDKDCCSWLNRLRPRRR